MTLIQTVRGLDQTGPGENGETLETLWRALAKSSDGRFHAAEESALRWLLKSMNGPSPAAETLRRYPLTWTILDRVFLRIPLFSLAKSLADRRFVAVLQQTLKDISKPSQQEPGSGTSPPNGKRKRSPDPRYTLDDLRGTDACVATGQAVFTLLRSLLSRLDDEAAGSKGSRGRIGAEHIKSLFSTSATEAAALASAALTLCGLLLSSGDSHETEFGIVEGQHDWIKTVSRIWDFHLQGTDDALEVATHLFKPAVSILAKVEAFPQHGLTTTPSEALAARWSSDLQQFMHRNFLLPARTAFLRQQDFETITRAIDVAASQARHAAPGLYLLAAGAPDPENERDMRRGNAAWMRKIFEAVEHMIRKLPDRNALMEHILGQAITKSIHVDVADLRKMYRTCGFKDGDGDTDWSLVAKAAVCNPDIFHSSADDDSLLKDVCQRSVRESEGQEHRAISELLGALQKSFCMRRQFPEFLKLWFGQLCALEERSISSTSPWFELGRKPGSPSTLMESELSPPLLLEVIEWLKEQEPLSHTRALCAFADSLAQGLRTEAFIDAVGTKLFDLVSPVSSSESTALKWRVVSKAVAWAPRDVRSQIWAQVKDELSKVLRKNPIKSAETFEALKCCSQIWDSMSRDGAVADEPAALVEKFTARLAERIASEEVLGANSAAAFGLDASTCMEYDEGIALQQYLAWYLLGSSRFLKLFWSRKGELPLALDAALTHKKANTDALRTLWDALMRNDVNINDSRLSKNIVDRLIAALEHIDQEKGGKGWPGKQTQLWIASLSSIPSEAFSRQQREQIMTILEHRRAGKVSMEGWKLVLDLSTKMMSRPTFHEGLQFSNLVEVADALSEFHRDESTAGEALLEQVQRYFALASTTIRQMAENRDERSTRYFTESAQFVSSKCDVGGPDQSSRVAPFRVTLLKALAAELSRSSTIPLSPDSGQQLERARNVLAQSVASAIGEFVGNSRLLSGHDVTADLSLFAAMDAAPLIDDALVVASLASLQLRPSGIRKLDKRSKEAMNAGDLRGWKLQIFLHRYLAGELEEACPTKMIRLEELPAKSRDGLLKDYVGSVTREMGLPERARYLAQLVREFMGDCDTDGQILAIDHVVHQLIEQTDAHGKADGVDLAAAHGELTSSLSRTYSPNTSHVCRVLHALLDLKPQAMGQWNIDLTLSTVSKLVSVSADTPSNTPPFPSLCKLVGVIIRRHRLRLEGHYHLLLATMQSLLRHLVNARPDDTPDRASWAQMYGRLVSLICEPTAGSVSRAQHMSALDTATDVAKRSAGRHMYLVLMEYVKLQLEGEVGREVREVLEPAMNTIFDITPPEVRKILNDAMDASGRAIMREMYKQYVKFGKWNGV